MTDDQAATAYPLSWPHGWKRTPPYHRQEIRFSGRKTFASARDDLFAELERWDVRWSSIVLSTNIELRRDGIPYANRREPEDPGVAVYFALPVSGRRLEYRHIVLACDQWDRVKDNMHALVKSIGALRDLERWGASQVLERAYEGFARLPAPGHTAARSWRDVLGLNGMSIVSEKDIEKAFRRKAMKAHPDRGGSDALMAELEQARRQGKEACQNGQG